MIRTAEWVLLAAGMGGFIVCIISDFVGLRAKKFAMALFFFGTMMIAAATIIDLTAYANLPAAFKKAPVLRGFAAIGGLFFVGLTIYSLVSVPNENYKTTEGKLTETGLYALCRHPGVWCLGGIYLFMGLMAGNPFVWAIGAANLAMDLVYVVCQDIYIFPRTIAGYKNYKTRVPFLIPNSQSVRRAFRRKDHYIYGSAEQ